MTYEVQQTRWDRIIRRVSGSIGPGSRVSETISELFPMIDVEQVPGELLLLGGTGIAHGGGNIFAAAAEFPTAQLFNPAGSGHLATLTGVIVSAGAATIVIWGTSIVARGAVISTQLFRDMRRLPPSLPVCRVSQDSAVAQASATNQARMPAAAPFKLSDPNGIAVLSPGTGFDIGFTTANIQIHYSFYWRERPAEQSELSL